MLQKVFAYGIIPLYTILFTRGYGWFTTNLSVIANYFDKKRAFFIWGILVGGYYYWVHRKIKEMSEQSPLCLKVIPGAIFFLFCSITTPYMPEVMPLKSDLHIIFAFASAVLLFLYLLAVILRQISKNRQRYLLYLAALIGIIFISLYLLIRVGIVSSALEIFVTVSTIVLSERLVNSMRGKERELLSAIEMLGEEDTAEAVS